MICLSTQEYEYAFVPYLGPSSLVEAIRTDREHGPGSWLAYQKFCESQDQEMQRLEAAGMDPMLVTVPSQMKCYECEPLPGRYVWQSVVKFGPVGNPADPTQSYVLACGHTVI